jgi:hypothetical protein
MPTLGRLPVRCAGVLLPERNPRRPQASPAPRCSNPAAPITGSSPHRFGEPRRRHSQAKDAGDAGRCERQNLCTDRCTPVGVDSFSPEQFDCLRSVPEPQNAPNRTVGHLEPGGRLRASQGLIGTAVLLPADAACTRAVRRLRCRRAVRSCRHSRADLVRRLLQPPASPDAVTRE